MKKRLKDILDYEQPTKYIVDSQNYSEDFMTPVLTAGKSFILGYTDETGGVFEASKNPVIIFDDFTSASKYVDFDFKVKSSAMKILHLVNPKDSLRYVYYAMQKIDYVPFSHKRLWISDYCNFEIELPDSAMQNRVVADLDTIQKAIDLKRKQLEDLDELVKSKFQEMFGNPLENEKRWVALPLSSIGSIARGVSKHRPRNAPELLGDYMPFIQTGDIANSGMYISNCQSGYSELGVEQSKIWHKGTLCITIAANIGKCAIMTFDACFPDSVVGFIANPSIVKVEYVYFYFLWIQQALEDNAIGVAQKNINLGVLNNMNIPVPPIEQQNSFVEYVKKADAAGNIIKQEISDLEELMDSKMDEYFG